MAAEVKSGRLDLLIRQEMKMSVSVCSNINFFVAYANSMSGKRLLIRIPNKGLDSGIHTMSAYD